MNYYSMHNARLTTSKWCNWKEESYSKGNYTLMDMVRSMTSNSSLPLSPCSEALKITIFILSRAPTKAIPKTTLSYRMLGKQNLGHIHIWGYLVEVRVYNPQEKKLGSKTISALFIGYAYMFKGFRFYCPSHISNIVEERNGRFLEDNDISESEQLGNLTFEEMEVLITTPTI